MPVQSLGQEDPLEEAMATHSSIIARKIPWTEKPGGIQSMGSQKSWTGLKRLGTRTQMSNYYNLGKKILYSYKKFLVSSSFSFKMKLYTFSYVTEY